MTIAFLNSRFINARHGSSKNWSNQDIADFYRAVDILKQAGIDTEVDSGFTDEGDPWFVFVRPDTGDVIAHFAQIDGSFVAVSSINHGVYRGKNIRSIVDEMLDSYPTLLPQDLSKGKLLLHPTAAISAFLAAAFILTVDGVKASDVSQVISSAATKNSGPNFSAVSLLEGILRTDQLKGTSSETGTFGYNFAVLGAALIAHEFLQDEPTFQVSTPLVVSSVEVYKTADDDDGVAETAVSLPEDRRPESFNEDTNHFVRRGILSQSESEEKNTPKKEPSTDLENAGVISADIDGINAVNEVSKNNKTDYLIESAPRTFINKNILPEISLADKGQNQDSDVEHRTVFEQTSSLQMEDLLNFEQITESAEPSFINQQNQEQLKYIVDLNDEGEFQLVSFKALNLDTVIDASSVQGIHDEFNPDSIVLQTTNDIQPSTTGEVDRDLSGSTNVTLGEPEKIIGHSLATTGDMLELSNDIDVIFYEGGNSEILGFELGTDLLWFFLSPEQVAGAKKMVNHYGDLMLDFGDIGTLTFRGMVLDASFDHVA